MSRQVLTLADLPPGVLTQIEAVALVASQTSAASALDAHEDAPHPHPGYLTRERADALYAPLAPVASTSINGKTGTVVLTADDVGALTEARAGLLYQAAGDYLTPAEADRRYAPAGDYLTGTEGDARYATPSRVIGHVVAHAGAGDPHPGYLTDARAGARYPSREDHDVLAARLEALVAVVGALQAVAGVLQDAVAGVQPRVGALEGQMGAGANGHYHPLETWRQTAKAVLPATVLEEAPAA